MFGYQGTLFGHRGIRMFGYQVKNTSITEQPVCSVIEFTSITDVRLSRYYCNSNLLYVYVCVCVCVCMCICMCMCMCMYVCMCMWVFDRETARWSAKPNHGHLSSSMLPASLETTM